MTQELKIYEIHYIKNYGKQCQIDEAVKVVSKTLVGAIEYFNNTHENHEITTVSDYGDILLVDSAINLPLGRGSREVCK